MCLKMNAIVFVDLYGDALQFVLLISSVMMQTSTRKPSVPTKGVAVTLGIEWQIFVTLALRCRSGWQWPRSATELAVVCTVLPGKTVTTHKSTQNLVMPTKGVAVTLGIEWQIFVTLALRCRSGWQWPRSAAELAVVCAVFSINARPGAANLSSCRVRLKNQCSASKTWTKHQSWYTWLNKNEQQHPTVKTLLRLPRSHSDDVAKRWTKDDLVSLLSDKMSGWTHHGRLHHLKAELQANEKKRQECDPKSFLEKYLRMKNLINNNLKSDWLNPDPSGPTRKRHNATTLHVTDRHRADRMSRTIHWFLLRRTCFPWGLLAQARTTTGRHFVALALLHWEDCTERRNKEDLVTSLCDVSSDATHWPTNKSNEPEARIEHMILGHSFWSRTLREQPPCLNLPDCSTQKFKHTRTHHLHFTNFAWSVVIGKQRRQDRQKRCETKRQLA